MSDLFHEQVPDEFIYRVFEVMSEARQHTFQVLTKRPERMRDLMYFWGNAADNVWLGVSIENRRYVQRADLLRETPAAVRFISAEPLLGPLRCLPGMDWPSDDELDLRGIDWLICGGESGPGHRPMREEWVRDLMVAAQTRCPLCVNGAALNPDGWTHDCEPGYGTPRCERTAFFFKQDSGPRSGSRGRFADEREWPREMPSRVSG
jgi:protein gp37